MLDYRIITFLTLCRCMSYRKTAEELNMTQPAVTQHIHYLENCYHCTLFSYDRHTLRRTAEAEILKQYAENLLYQANALTERMRQPKDICLHIGATKTIGEYVLAEHADRFTQKEENRLEIEVENTRILLEKLKDGKLDFALVEGNFSRKEFAWKLYRSEPFVGVCSVRHPFAGRTVDSGSILRESLIIREEGSGTRRIFEALLENENLTIGDFRKVSCVNNFGLMTGMLRRGGITFAYQAVAEGNPELAVFQVRGWKVSHDFSYVCLDNPESRDTVELFDSFRLDPAQDK